MSQVAVIVKGLHWHKNAWKIHKGRWPASRTQLFTFSAAARNAASLFSKQPVVVRSTGLCRCQARTSQGHLLCCLLPQTHRDPTGHPEGSLCRWACRWGWGFRVALARPVRQHSGDLVLSHWWLSRSENTGLSFVAPVTVDPQGTAKVGLCLGYLLRICYLRLYYYFPLASLLSFKFCFFP